MKIITNLLSDSAVSAFGWALVHSVWQGIALLAVAVSTLHLLRNRSVNVKYAVSVIALAFQVVASGITFSYYYMKFSAPVISQTSGGMLKVSGAVVLDRLGYEQPMALKVQLWLSTHISELVICWLIGAAVLLLRFAAGWIFTEHLRFNSKIVMDKEWRARFGVLTAKLNISQSVEFKETAKILTPMVIGALRPVVLIPIGLLSGFSTAQVEAILAHELAHIRRNDYLVNILQSFVEVVFFFHPAIWWLSARIRSEREHCCDDIAVSISGDRISLAHALVKVAEWQAAPRMAMAFASKKPLLLQRIQRVMGLTPKPVRLFGNLPIMFLAIGLVVSVSLYAVAQKSEKSKDKKVSKQVNRKVPVASSKQNELTEEIEIAQHETQIEEINENVVELQLENFHGITFDNDSLNQKLNEAHRRMRELQAEMEPIHHRMEELNLEMEKQHFEVERFERDREKMEWKKGRAMESRSGLMEKRSELFDMDNKTGQSKLNETEVDKQVSAFEQQIKAQEQIIAELNGQIAASRKEGLKAEEPVNRLEQEMEELSRKIEEISYKMEKESRMVESYAPAPPPPPAPRAARTPRPAKMRVSPPPAVAPSAATRPAKAPASPTPPLPPAKK